MKALSNLLIVGCFALLATANDYLTPLDFGFGMLHHGIVDFCNPPPNTKAGYFDSDDYLDIARFDGNQLEIFISSIHGFTLEPQQLKTFSKPIASLGFGGTIWDTHPPLKVTFTDGTEELFYLRRGMLDLGVETTRPSASGPPRTISDLEFNIVWESEEYPERMNECTVGDLDGDGVMEFVSSWKENNFADTVHIVIYKNSGDDTYELFMDELFFDPIIASSANTSFLMVTDIDQDGQNELMFTYDGCYFWEFSAPGEYIRYRSNFVFPRGVVDAKITDVDEDSVPEVTTVMLTPDLTPPCAYWVCEFEEKDAVNYMMNFDILSGFWQDWPTARIAVGDFDNDGAVDIVQGNHILLSSSDPVDVPFYRYNSGSSDSFDLHWLETNLVIRCACPVIEDFDNDGDLDLFAEGFTIGAGAAFVWEGTGLLNGYVSWIDIGSSFGSIDFVYYGVVNGAPSIVSSCTPYVAPTTTSALSMWRWENSGFTYTWETPYIYNADYRMPHLADMDGDGKISILLVEDDHNKMIDWEQVSLGVWDQPKHQAPAHFKLNPVYPNPFNATTVIPFELARASDVRLSIYDISGRIVHEEYEANMLPGQHYLTWQADNLCSGIYLVRIESESVKQTVKAVLLK
ncbi:T9SS type A sorting domain-containing protein [bacterium]|nr:T9SS type A sorting domain-containing protein [bacterium]